MLGMLGSKWFLGGLAGLVVVTVLGLGYRHYTGLLDEVELLSARQAQLDLALDIERETVVSLGQNLEEWKEAQDDLVQTIERMQDEAHEARAEARRLRRLFAELDFESMSAADVDSVATGIIDRLWGLLEAATDPGRYSGDGESAAAADSSEARTDRGSTTGVAGTPDGAGSDAGTDGGAVQDPR